MANGEKANVMVDFIKMHGLGNDYVYIDCFVKTTAEIIAKADLARLARRVSDRHRGVGSDGLVLILPSDKADARMRMFNADGTEAQMCGNAIRCVGKYLYESGLCTQTRMTIDTLAGIRELRLDITAGKVREVTVGMGTPRIEEDSIDLETGTVPFWNVNMGNPHAVFFYDWMVTTSTMLTLGEKIGTHPHFPEGTNVEFACIRNRQEIDLRVWERGTGETMACGTGACATAVAAISQGKTEEKVTIHLPGGDLTIQWQPGEQVYMTGPAEEVFRGEIGLVE